MRLILPLILIIPAIVLILLPKTSKQLKLPESVKQVLQAPTPKPFLFEEMTIPYLRSRTYTSKIGDLEKYQDHANYTSYLTSYDSDGLKINGLLTIPDGDGLHPAIVFVHGYIDPKVYRTTERYIQYVDTLARNGFVVFKIDIRGHDKSEGEAQGAYHSGDYVVDALNAYAALESADFVDPERIGLWGHSMAGNILSRTIAVKKDIPAAVIWAGMGFTYSDILEYGLRGKPFQPNEDNPERQRRVQVVYDAYGTFDPESWFWKQVPGTNYLDGVTTKIELHHAVDDPDVSVEYSRNLIKVLDQTEVPHQLFEYQSGGHNISGSAFTEAMSRTVEFFKENL